MELNSPTTEPADDEYDELNVSIDPEFMPYIIDLPASQEIQDTFPCIHATSTFDAPTSPKSTHSDEYSKYDFSEFTAEELAAFDDQFAFTNYESAPQANPPHFRDLSSGPAVEIEIEKSADAPIGGQTAAEDVPSVAPLPQPSNHGPRKPTQSEPQQPTYANLYLRFRRKRKTLAVTDLTSPIWCEVRWQYTLLGKRHRKIENRPESFVSAAGKVIHVDKVSAETLDKTSKEGQKVHKALEREIHPKKAKVKVATDEENWALRILQMVDCIQSLVALGRCREMPVFGVLQGQAVVGVIDEIRRELPPESPLSGSSSSSPTHRTLKRERGEGSVPVSPSKPSLKKSRRSPSPSQPTITTFFSHTLNASPSSSHTRGGSRPSTPSKPKSISVNSHPRYRLYISDTKSRNSTTLPSKEDQEPAHAQLMVYHRLLSSILAHPPTVLRAFWSHVGLSRSLKFSQDFKAKAGLSDANCLADLEPVLKNAFDMLHVDGVDNKLQIEYRTQSTVKKRAKSRKGKKGKGKASSEAVSEESEADNHSSSKGDGPIPPGATEATTKLGQAKQSTTENGSTTEIEINVVSDPTTIPDVEQSSAPQVEATEVVANATTQGDAAKPHVGEKSTIPNGCNGATEGVTEFPPGTGVPTGRPDTSSDSDSDGGYAEVRERSRVLGTKEFFVDDDRLDAHISSILDLWYGKRQPVGVEAALTRRCTWCEYRDGCEWRELKAEEAQAKLRQSPKASCSRT